ncbi:hypothetical protein KGY71_02920 [Candidatus Bipolaricaulota bacterium]|nr:hypothetical protein [Candidatus Bipolaricaulota bacterium]
MRDGFLEEVGKEAGTGDLKVRVAWAYYKENLTQKEISDRYNINRTKVYRLIREAREGNVVSIDISHPDANLLKMEKKLTGLYELEDALIVPYTPDENLIKKMLGEAGGFFLRNKAGCFPSLGVSIGGTLEKVAESYKPTEEQRNREVDVVSLTGNLAGNIATTPYSVGNVIADKLGADFYNIWAPAVAEDAESAEVFRSETWVKKVLEKAEGVELMLMGVGTVSTSAEVFRELDYLSEEEISNLKRKGAVGDALGQFFDESGEIIENGFRDRIVGISLEKLRGRSGIVGVAGGKKKYEGILAGLRGNFFNVLITDEWTARKLIEKRER